MYDRGDDPRLSGVQTVGRFEWERRLGEKSFGFRRNLLPARTFRSRSGGRHILDKCTSRRIASKTMHGDCTITAIYHHPVFQRGLYVRHELVEKVLQTLRLRPATVSPTANGSALTPIT